MQNSRLRPDGVPAYAKRSQTRIGNEFEKKKKPVRIRERVSTLNAFHNETVSHRVKGINGSIIDPIRFRSALIGVPQRELVSVGGSRATCLPYDCGDKETEPAGAVKTSSPPSAVAFTVCVDPPAETVQFPALTPET